MTICQNDINPATTSRYQQPKNFQTRNHQERKPFMHVETKIRKEYIQVQTINMTKDAL